MSIHATVSNIDGRDPVAGAFHDAWETLTTRYSDVFSVMAFAGLVGGGFSLLESLTANISGNSMTLAILFASFFFAAQAGVSAGASYALLRLVRGERAGADTVLSGLQRIQEISVTTFLSLLLMLAGGLLLIVPGIVAALGLSMAALLIMDRRLSGVGALGASWRLMKGKKFALFMLGVANMSLLVVNITPILLVFFLFDQYFWVALLLSLAFGLGLFVTVPLTSLSFVAFYNRVLRA